VLARYSDSWFAAAKRRRKGEPAGFPRRKRLLVPVRFHHQTFQLDGRRVRLPVARGRPALWVRTARPIPYPADRIRAVTLVADCGQLWLAVTAAVPVHHHDLDPRQVAKTARRAPKPGQHGSRRWRRYRARLRRVEARHRRRVHQAHHQAASQVVAFAVRQRIGVLVIGDPTGITTHDAGRVHNRRLRQWRRTHLVQALNDKAEQAGIDVRRVDERGTSSTCPACRRRVPKPSGRRFRCLACTFQGHRDLVGAANIAATLGGGTTSATLPTLVEHRRAGIVPARRDRRRHLHDQRRRRSCLASGHPDGHKSSSGCHSPHATTDPASDEDQATRRHTANVA
jgi:IS605 OrfB family transposase